MSLGTSIERFAKHLLLAPRVLARYGTLRPSRIRISGCKHWVHIDPTDRRAVKKFIYDPVRNRISPPLAFWRDFNAHLKPAVALDVGVNYGECLFGTRYAPGTHVFGFEANPRLMPFLERSESEHPDGARITLTHGLVSDALADAVPFYVDPEWSGTASAVRDLNTAPGVLDFKIPARTLDSVIPPEKAAAQSVLFKMDIEGFEPRAFGGFWQTIDAAALAVGFIEFDSTYISAAGESPAQYLERLIERFDVFRSSGNAGRRLLQVKKFQDIPRSRAADGRVHTDLILVKRGASDCLWLPPGWTCAATTLVI